MTPFTLCSTSNGAHPHRYIIATLLFVLALLDSRLALLREQVLLVLVHFAASSVLTDSIVLTEY